MQMFAAFKGLRESLLFKYLTKWSAGTIPLE